MPVTELFWLGDDLSTLFVLTTFLALQAVIARVIRFTLWTLLTLLFVCLSTAA